MNTFAACDSVLIVGGRGTGKSTMLDYVIGRAAPSLHTIYAFGITLPPSVPTLFSSTEKRWEWHRTLHAGDLQAIIEQQQRHARDLDEGECTPASRDQDAVVTRHGKLPRVGVVFDDCDSGFRNLDSIRFLLAEGKNHNFFIAISAQVVDVVPRGVRDAVQVVVAFPERSPVYRKSLQKMLPVFSTDASLLAAFSTAVVNKNDALVFDATACKDGRVHLFRCNAKTLEFESNNGASEVVPRFKVEFGVDAYWSDVTRKYAAAENVIVPRTDEARVVFFGTDPRPGVKKQVLLTDDFGAVVRLDAGQGLVMTRVLGKCAVKSACVVRPEQEIQMIRRSMSDVPPQYLAFLQYLHATLTLKHNRFDDVYGNVYPEQEMLVRYIPEDAHVLELGGDIGRNSCIIAALLRTSSNLVVFEADGFAAEELAANRARNGFDFSIEAKALSSLCSEQHIGWSQLQEKYAWLSFDTLLAGKLYHTLHSEPELLLRFQRVLLQNNYKDDAHKSFVAKKLVDAGMTCVYAKPLEHHVATALQDLITPACVSSFYEVWTKE